MYSDGLPAIALRKAGPVTEPAPSPPFRGAAIFDSAVFLANLLLVGPLTSLVHAGEDISPLFGALLLGGCLSYSVGAWLKRRPLQARMMRQPAWGGGAFLLFLVLGTMHLGVFGLAAELGVEALRFPDGLAIAIGVIAGVPPTCLAIFAMIPMRQAQAWDERQLHLREAGADAALWAGTVLLCALWEGAIMPTVAGKAGGSAVMAAVLVVLMTVPFAIFYLAPRMLFLVEDFRKGGTWLRILVVAAPMGWRLVTG